MKYLAAITALLALCITETVALRCHEQGGTCWPSFTPCPGALGGQNTVPHDGSDCSSEYKCCV
ncbi:hypothetical protein BJX66DRAFT_289300 [Aspergillus keveii]|uniref:Uncharacterized protein n=1 Tax=Aspergillus keveii TaxID=714993 RepID=A0ABR4GQ58_9EURO